ncbi:MAG: DUF4861 domain-containing protein, partial [Duncaniella sp.]|nr:DUF4861 domain-containing protein [Duncaniella sp.]
MTLSFITALLTSLAVTVSNPLQESRTDVPVVVTIPSSAGSVTSARVTNAADVPCQLDDMNADGVADELVMLINMKPGEPRTLNVSLSTDG